MSQNRPYRFPFARYPAVRFALLFIAGILLCRWLALNGYFWSVLFGITVTGWIGLDYLSRKSLQPVYTYCSISFYLLGILLFGAFWQSFSKQGIETPSSRLISAYMWESIEVRGTVQRIKQSSSGKYRLDVAADSTVVDDSLAWLESYTLRAIYDPSDVPLPESLELGSMVSFNATVYPLEGKRNPHSFDYKSYLASQNIYVQAGITEITEIQPDDGWLSWIGLRRVILRQIEHNFSEQTVPLAKALLIGHKNDLRVEDRLAFSRAGLSHIMAVSGLHVGFIITPFWFIIPFFWTFRRGKQLGLFLLVGLLVFYAGITGFSASVTRASITAGLLAYGKLFHKSRDSINLTAVAAIIILLVSPGDLFDIGFQLSFTAVYIILLVLPVLQRIIPKRIQHRWYSTPVMVVIVSLVVQVGLYPLLSYYFGEFSLIGPLANALVLPWLGLIVPYALFLLPISVFFPGFGFTMNAPCRWFLEMLQWVVTSASSWPWSWIQTPSTGLFIFLIWIAVLSFVVALPVAKLRWKFLILLLFVFCTNQVYNLVSRISQPRLQITMLDVEQGDAALVSTPYGRHFLIDAGRWTPTYNSARYIIIPHLKALGINKLDGVFLSHPHADHIGGVLELMNEIEIVTIYNSGYKYDSELYQDYIMLAGEKGIPVKSLSAGVSLSVDPAIRLFVYGPDADNHHGDPNERSLVMELVYGETEFMFMGDAGAEQEALLLENYDAMLNTDFLKVGHHGSRTGSSQQFLQMTTPDISAVSLAKRNKFNHPHPEAIRQLADINTKMVFTSLDGALQFQSDGKNIYRKKWR